MNRISFRNGINGCLDNMAKRITRKTLRIYGENDWPGIKSLLREWQGNGYLHVLKDPENTADEDICVEMLSYIEQKQGQGVKAYY